MDENVVITLSSSDEECDYTKPSGPNVNVSTLKLNSKLLLLPPNVTLSKSSSNKSKINVKRKAILNKVDPKLVGRKSISKRNPEVVDLVDCFDKPTEEEVGILKDDSSERFLNNNHSEKEIIEIDTKSQGDEQDSQSPEKGNEEDNLTENKVNNTMEESAIATQNCSTSVQLKTDEDAINEVSKDLTDNTSNFYTEFVSYCGSFEEIPNDRTRLEKKLMKRFAEADPRYIKSQEFRNLIDKYRDKLKRNNLYLIAKNVTEELICRKKLNLSAINTSKTNQRNGDEVTNNEIIEENNNWSKKQRNLIRKISKKLDKMGKKIRELEEAEVDLSDEEDSTYVQLQRYREKFCQIYKRLCAYKKEVSDANREYCRKVSFNGSKYPAINKCIETWLNKTKRFPDFTDIVKLLESQSSSLGLPSNRDLIRATATEIFQQVGMMLQRRRKYDLWDSFCGYLNEAEDPASKDPELEKILQQNFETRVKKEEKIVQYYAEMQEKEKLEPEEVPEEVANNSPVETGSEDEEEIETIETFINQRFDAAMEDHHLGDTKEHDDSLLGEKSNQRDSSSEEEAETSKEEVSTALKESKNNYKNCKSVKWRSENGAKGSGEGSKYGGIESAVLVTEVAEVKENCMDCVEHGRKRVHEGNPQSGGSCKRKRPSWKEDLFEKENMTQVFDIHYCQVEHHIDFGEEEEDDKEEEEEDKEDEANDWKRGKVFRDLTNVKRLMELYGGRGGRRRRKASGLFSLSFPIDFHKKPSWRKRFQIGYKSAGPKKYGLNQEDEEKSGKNMNEDGGESEERGGGSGGGEGDGGREVQNNSEGGGEDGSNYLSGQGSGSEEDNNENDENKRNGGREGDKMEEDKDEENEEEEGEKKSVEHSSEEPSEKTEQEGKEKEDEKTELDSREVEEKEVEECCDGNKLEEKETEEPMQERDEEVKEEGEEEEKEEENTHFIGQNEMSEETNEESEKREDIVGENERMADIREQIEISEEINEERGKRDVKENEKREKIDRQNENREFIDEVNEKREDINEQNETSEETDEESVKGEDEDIVEENEKSEDIFDKKEKREDIEKNEMSEEIVEEIEKVESIVEKNEISEDIDEESEKREDIMEENGEREEIDRQNKNREFIVDVKEKREDIQEQNEVSEEINEDGEKREDIVEMREDIFEENERMEDIREQNEISEETDEESEKREDIIEKNEMSEDTVEENERMEDIREQNEISEDIDEESEKREDIVEESEKMEDIREQNEISEEFDEESEKGEDKKTEERKYIWNKVEENEKHSGETNRKMENEKHCQSPKLITSRQSIEDKTPISRLLERKKARKNNPTDEERVKRFLLHSPSSISITPPKKLTLAKPPSQAVIQALATLRGLKDISATRVRGSKPRGEGEEVVVIGGSSSQHAPNTAKRRRNDLPVISNVQSIKSPKSTTPKILTVQGNVSGFENPWSQVGNNGDPSSLRISNVWGNLPNDFLQSMHNNEAAPGCSFRHANPTSNTSVRKKSTKKTVEYVVLE